MKHGPVTKLDKRNMPMSKNDYDIILSNCDIISNFTVYDQFGAMWKPDSR